MTKSKSAPTNWHPRTVFRPVGYCLLVLAIIDIIDILFPLQLLNFNWELFVIPQLVERVAVPLIAIALIFYGETRVTSRIEVIVLKVLRWFSLLLGVFFILLLPLILVDTPRLQAQINTDISRKKPEEIRKEVQEIQKSKNSEQAAIYQQKIQLFNERRGFEQREALVTEIEKVAKKGNNQELKNLLTRLNPSQPVTDQNLAQAKEGILKDAPETKKQLQTRIQQLTTSETLLKSNATQSALTNAIKYAIGTLISGILFIYIWKVNR
jgi:predicted house-cleaning noncanonical NTP pyrophosphatase (MazG superfamily)